MERVTRDKHTKNRARNRKKNVNNVDLSILASNCRSIGNKAASIQNILDSKGVEIRIFSELYVRKKIFKKWLAAEAFLGCLQENSMALLFIAKMHFTHTYFVSQMGTRSWN